MFSFPRSDASPCGIPPRLSAPEEHSFFTLSPALRGLHFAPLHAHLIGRYNLRADLILLLSLFDITPPSARCDCMLSDCSQSVDFCPVQYYCLYGAIRLLASGGDLCPFSPFSISPHFSSVLRVVGRVMPFPRYIHCKRVAYFRLWSRLPFFFTPNFNGTSSPPSDVISSLWGLHVSVT